jgi:Domain of unknown function (DUF397)
VKKSVWIKSTRSGNSGNCTEVRDRGMEIDVRDSKDPNGPMLTFTRAEWTAFIGGAKDGEFDEGR